MIPIHPGATPPDPRIPAEPRYWVNTWAARTGQRVAARWIDSMLALGCIAIVVVAGPRGRPVAQDLLIVALVTAIETFAISRSGATPGMRVLDIRVASVGRSGNPDALDAARRSLPVALCYAVLIPGTPLVLVMPVVLWISIALSPLRRGFHDRLSGTVVVQRNAPAVITDEAIATWWQLGQQEVMSPWGRVPDLYDRRRARAHRIDGAWWLAAFIMGATIVSVGAREVPMLWVWITFAWLTVATIDETWWVATRGATPGHAHAGFRVVDLTTGLAPTRSRALLRAVVLAPLLYIPPLQLIGALWVHASALHRGPHDLLAHTVVVEPDYTPKVFLAPPTRPLTGALPGPGTPIPDGVPAGLHPVTPPPPPAPAPTFVPGPF